MTDSREYHFKIDAFTPDTLPMARLSEYMGNIAKILGEEPYVHFVRIDSGSAVLVQKIDEAAVERVRRRASEVRSGDGPDEAMTAYKRINTLLKEDNGIGTLSESGGGDIIEFPGKSLPEPTTFDAFSQEGSLDGIVIRVGGSRDQVPVLLQSENRTLSGCYATRDLAKDLGHYLFGPELRLHGTGKWHRDVHGNWALDRFTVASFEVLDNEPLSSVVAKLRDIPNNGWDEVSDPWGELERIRYDPDEVQ